MAIINCEDCNSNFTIGGNSNPSKIDECPNCGSKELNGHVSKKDTIKYHDHLALSGGKDGKTEFFRESKRADGRSTSADTEDDGTISHSAKGASPQGEEYTLRICKTLIQKLNSLGSNLGDPILGTGVIDCKSFNQNNQKNIVEIQVVRATVNNEFWKKLNAKNFIAKSNIPTKDLVNEIVEAIDHKVKKIPPHIREDIYLALDAEMTPQLVLDKVVDNFRNDYLKWIQTLNFKQVWIVGPTSILTHRLDCEYRE